MGKVIVAQIKGPSGSGKSTIVKQMMDDDTYYVFDGKKPYATIFPNLGWAAIGPYKATGGPTSCGCDSVGKVALIKEYIGNVLDDLPGYNIVFEGAMISTIISTFYNYLLELEESDDIKPVFVLLKTTSEGCLRRIESRGSRRPKLNVERLAGRCNSIVSKAFDNYDHKYLRLLETDSIEKFAMLNTFLGLVNSDKV